MRKLNSLILAFILVIGMVLNACIVYALLAVPNATSEFYVNDFAGIFSPEEKSQLLDNAIELADTYDGVQVVVTTIKTLDGASIVDYSVEMFNKYKIGQNDMGVLILLATEDLQIFVNTGVAMEAYITDSKAGQLIDDYAIPYFRQNQFKEGLISLQEAIISEIKQRVEKDIPPARSNIDVQESVSNTESRSSMEVQESTVSVNEQSSNVSFGTVLFIIVLSTLGVAILVLLVGLIINKKNLQKKLQNVEEKLKVSTSNHQSTLRALESKHSSAMESMRSEYASTLSNMQSQHESDIQKLQSKYEAEKADLQELQRKYNSLSQEYAGLQEYCDRAKKLHPNLDKEIDAMIAHEIEEQDKAAANSYDESISSLLTSKPAAGLIDSLESAIRRFHLLTGSQQKFVKSDISVLESLLRESRILLWKQEAESISSTIRQTISHISRATAAHLEVLRSLSRSYEGLCLNSRQLVDKELIDELNRLLRQAQEDQDRIDEERRKREEEERRRREEEARRRREEEERRRREEEARRKREEEERRRREEEARRKREEEERRRREQRRREEEERRRRNSSSFSSSSFHSSSHSGFGGRTGGGGAGRSF